jgi:hypothetical protein
MATYSDKFIDMGGWDIAHAIRFNDINKAIKKAYTQPISFAIVKFVKGDKYSPVDKLIKLTASYTALNLIATYEGYQSGFLVSINIEHFSVTILEKAKPGNPILITDKGIDYTAQSAPAVYHFGHTVGIIGSMEFEWHQSQPQSHQLITPNDLDKIEIFESQTIMHPDETLLANDEDTKSDRSFFNIVIQQALAKSLAEEFNHILATVDYTQTADHHATWLRPTLHGHFTQKVGKTTTINDSTLDYAGKMAIQNYPTGYLAVLGMTNNRTQPDGVPTNLDAIIPENCMAGFAYNHSLIIPNLIEGHLSDVFEADVAKDFYYTGASQTTLENSNAITVREKVKLDFSTLGSNPILTGQVAPLSVAIFLDKGKVMYHTTINYHVPKADISTVFPYNLDILQTVELSFDYQINEHGYALLHLRDDPTVNALITPQLEESHHIKSFWTYAKSFGEDLALSLAIVGITVVLIKAGRGAFKAIKWLGTKIRVSALGEIAKLEEIIGHQSIINEIEKEAAAAEKEGHLIPVKTEEELIKTKKDKIVDFVKTALKTIWELVCFSVAATLVQMAKEKYNQIQLNELTDEANRKAFVQFINTALCTISWASQDDEKQFTIKEGGLAQGGFIVGMDIDFKY